MSYQLAVNNTPSINNCFRAGLQALGANSAYISVANPRDLNGSVDLDKCLLDSQPNASRWDYTFGYCNQSYYIEIHHAGTNEVDTIIKKFDWLKNWLRNEGAHLDALNASAPFHWVASGKVSIPLGSAYHRRLTSAGLSIPKTRLVL